MKKLLCVLLLGLFVGGVLGCKKEPAPVKPPEKAPATTPETPKTE